MNLSDEVLLDQFKRGDIQAFSAIFLRYYAAINRLVYGLTGSQDQSDDLTQEVFVKLYRNPPSRRGEYNLKAWLYRVALNEVHNSRRSRQREERRHQRVAELALPKSDELADPADEILRQELREQVRHILRSMPPKQCQCLILRHEGLSYAEIAQILGIPATSVGSLLARAEAEFARRFREAHGEVNTT